MGHRPHRPEQDDTGARSGSGFALAGIKLVIGDRRLLAIAGLIWLVGFYVAAEALAVPYVAEIDAPYNAVGVLMSSMVIGTAIGALLVAKLNADWRRRLTVPLAAAAGVPLMVPPRRRCGHVCTVDARRGLPRLRRARPGAVRPVRP